MEKDRWQQLLRQHRAIAVIRAPTVEIGGSMADAVYAGGMRLIEVTWRSHQPAQLIAELRQRYPDAWIGAGTLMTAADMQVAIAAGAQFGFSPHTDVALIQQARAAQLPIMPGALTPTEIVQAWQTGASVVKVFPIGTVGGASYIRSLQGPLPHIPLLPTGGVTLENAPTLIEAGAVAVGLSNSLFPQDAVKARNWSITTQKAQSLCQTLSAHIHPAP